MSTRHKTAKAVTIKVLSDTELAKLEARAAAATHPFTKAWLGVLVKRQYDRRSKAAQLERARADTSDRETLQLDARGFAGVGGGRMSTIMPPVEYRATNVQVAGLFPWIVGANSPILGTPLGFHLNSGAGASPVCFDPLSAWKAKTITAPSCFICALNGFGKSTLLRRLALGDIAKGVRVIFPGDVKPDCRTLTEEVGGQVSEVGYGIGTLNPLDPGPIGAALVRLTDPVVRQQIAFALHARQLNMIAGLCEIVRRSALKDFEQTMLASAIRLLYTVEGDGGGGFTAEHPAILSDLIALIGGGHDELMADAVADTATEYREQIKPLLRTLRALVKGRFGEVFNGQSTVRLNVNDPAICLDMSSVPPGDELMRGAVLLSGWNEAFATIEAAHVLADAGLGPNLAFSVYMDELWQVLQCGPMMVGRIDAVQRLQRAIGVGITFVTHSLTELDKAGALGMVERCRARIIGAVPAAEIGRLEQLMQFSDNEKALLTGSADAAALNSPIDQKAERRRRFAAKSGVPDTELERKPVAAGTGQFLLKLGEGRTPGIPFKVWVTPAERAAGIHDTDARLNAANAEDEQTGTAA